MRQADIYFSTLVIQEISLRNLLENTMCMNQNHCQMCYVRDSLGCTGNRDSKELYVNHRVVGDLHYYMVSNSTNKKRQVTLQLRQEGSVIRMDPETGKTLAIPSHSKDGGTRIVVNLEADEACYLLLDKREVSPVDEKAIEVHAIQPITGHWSFMPLVKEYDSRWDVDSNHCMLDIPIAVSSESGTVQLIRIIRQANLVSGRHQWWTASWIRRPSWCDDSDATDYIF